MHRVSPEILLSGTHLVLRAESLVPGCSACRPRDHATGPTLRTNQARQPPTQGVHFAPAPTGSRAKRVECSCFTTDDGNAANNQGWSLPHICSRRTSRSVCTTDPFWHRYRVRGLLVWVPTGPRT